MDAEAQAIIDSYKRPDGMVDYYKVLELTPAATEEQVRDSYAILEATYHPSPGGQTKEAIVKHVLIKQAFAELSNSEKRKKYDAFLRHQRDHARLLVALEAEKQRQAIAATPQPSNASTSTSFLSSANTRSKRVALLAFPFFACVAIYRLAVSMTKCKK